MIKCPRGFNSQPPEGGWRLMTIRRRLTNRFQLTAARRRLDLLPGCRLIRKYVSTHSRPKAAGGVRSHPNRCLPFQLTAARRRLGFVFRHRIHVKWVSTHSRPKAAGVIATVISTEHGFQLTAARRRLDLWRVDTLDQAGFNSQPPEGGWPVLRRGALLDSCFNSQPPEGGWEKQP